MRTSRVAVQSAVLGQVLGGDPQDQLAERTAHRLRRGQPLGAGGGEVLGCGEREQDLAECGAFEGGQGEPAVGLAVPVVVHRQVTRPVRGSFFGFEDRGFAGVGLVGGDDLEQVLAQHPQRLGVVVGGLGQQVGFASTQVGVDVVGQLLDRVAGSPAPGRAAPRRGRGRRGSAGEPRGRGRASPCRARPGGWSSWCAPASSQHWTRRPPGRRAGRRRARPPGPSTPRPAPPAGSARPGSRRSRQRPSTTRDASDHGVGRSPHLRGRDRHPVTRCGLCCHGSTQALSTDSQRPRTPCFVWHVDTFEKIASEDFRWWFRDRTSSFLNHRAGGRKAGKQPQPEALPYPRHCLSVATTHGPQAAGSRRMRWFRDRTSSFLNHRCRGRKAGKRP